MKPDQRSKDAADRAMRETSSAPKGGEKRVPSRPASAQGLAKKLRRDALTLPLSIPFRIPPHVELVGRMKQLLQRYTVEQVAGAIDTMCLRIEVGQLDVRGKDIMTVLQTRAHRLVADAMQSYTTGLTSEERLKL